MPGYPKIGIAGVFSGPRAAYGDLLQRHVRAAGLAGVTYVFADDAGDPATAEAVAKELIASGVKAVVGHFNSDCARRAGRLYWPAGVPLLLPAATAQGLAQEVGAFRFCAPDDRQIAAIRSWCADRAWPIGEVWRDGSAYSRRLGDLVECSVPLRRRNSGSRVAVLLGAHHNVAAELQRRADGREDVTYVASDDCAIAEFRDLIADCPVRVHVALPVPTFGQAVEAALGTLGQLDLQVPPEAVRAGLRAMPRFEEGEDQRNASFDVVRVQALEPDKE